MKETRNFGYWSTLDSNSVIDISIEVGFEFIILDIEHGLHTIDSISRTTNLLKKANRKVFARIPNNGFSLIQRLHDVGIDGILFPMLHKRENIIRAIKETSLQPNGNLGYNPFVSRFKYGKSNMIAYKGIKCIGMIEDLDLFEDTLKNYISLGIDGCYIGAYDMNIKAGFNGDMDNKEYLNKLLTHLKLDYILFDYLQQSHHMKGLKTQFLYQIYYQTLPLEYLDLKCYWLDI